MRQSWVVPAALMSVATVAFPCGGSEVYRVEGPLTSAVTFADRALYPPVDLLEYLTRDEIRFLPGLVRADSAQFAALVGRSPLNTAWWDTTARVRVSEPTAREMEAAWNRGDAVGAVRAARQVVSTVMALPFAADSARDVAFRLAVETIEIAPAVASMGVAARKGAFERIARPFRGVPFDSLPLLLSRESQSPRRVSLEYAALRGAVRVGVPDETREEIVKQVPAARWDSLHAAHRAWLAANPAHPYAGLVQFSRVRLFFLAMQPDSAWSTALALQAQYPARAAAEMRHLLITGTMPPARLLTDQRVPLALRAALVGNMRPTMPVWTSLMQQAAARPRDALTENLEERLLATLASDSVARVPLPASFPSWRATASPLWRYLWAVNMLRAGRAVEALPFTAVPITARDDSLLAVDAAMLTVRLHLMRGDWIAAASTPGIDEWTRRYVVRVLTPDSVMVRLRDASDRAVRQEARLVLATRAAQAGRWTDAAAEVRGTDARRAALYTRLGVLSRDTATNAGLLRFTAAVGAAGGQMFYESSRYFYRGMVDRDYTLYPRWAVDSARTWDLPWRREEERARLFRYLRDGSERYLALQLYASYFDRPGVTAAQRRSAVQAANRVYRALLATDPSRSESGYWADSLPASAVARAIRGAGRR